MANHLEGKVLVVTGAGSGFGRLISEQAGALGAKVVCCDVDEAAVNETVSTLTENSISAIARVVDVTKLAELQAVTDAAQQTYGALDVMVNNAGTMPLGFYSDHAQAYEAWVRCLDVNIKGVLNGIIAAQDIMLEQGRGHIVNMSSIYGNYPVVGAGVYGATKAAVNFLSESLRIESQGKIKVTIVKPTGVPGTNLGTGIVNPEAIVGILGHRAGPYGQLLAAHQAGELPAEYTDPEHIEYYALEPEYLAQQVIYAMNQPWGVAIGDITVRATGDGYVL